MLVSPSSALEENSFLKLAYKTKTFEFSNLLNSSYTPNTLVPKIPEFFSDRRIKKIKNLKMNNFILGGHKSITPNLDMHHVIQKSKQLKDFSNEW